MERAEDLFNRIVRDGEAAIDAFILDRQSEELFLDFKRSADDGKGTKLHERDRQNLAKAISGFGNSEGGIIVWGVDCRDDGARGDVAQCKVPIEDPKRFLSRLEGAVSGCTVPVHSQIRHHAVDSGISNIGFVATYIPKSFLAPHQTVNGCQYFMRAGSNFSPVPHAVLSGLFGRPPQPFLFHNWVYALPEIKVDKSVHLSLTFALVNGGPGIARELYVNVRVFRPDGSSRLLYKPLDEQNWSGKVALGHMFNMFSKDSYRLAPGAVAEPVSIELYLLPPFTSKLVYEITFGHQNWPMRKLVASVEPNKIAQAYGLFLSGQGQPSEATQKLFLEEVFPFKEGSRNLTPGEYEAWLCHSQPGV
jgi:hypothetical protein